MGVQPLKLIVQLEPTDERPIGKMGRFMEASSSPNSSRRRRAEVGIQPLQGDRPVAVRQHVLDAAAHSPAHAGGAFRLVEAKKSGLNL